MARAFSSKQKRKGLGVPTPQRNKKGKKVSRSPNSEPLNKAEKNKVYGTQDIITVNYLPDKENYSVPMIAEIMYITKQDVRNMLEDKKDV